LFRCMFDVIFVTNKSMMTIPTRIVTTPPKYADIPEFLCILAVLVFLNI